MSSPDYYASHKGLAKISESEDYFITYCVPWTLIVLFVLPLLLYFNEYINILCTVSQLFEHFHHIRTYTVHISHLFLAFYHILKELRQLHFNGKEIQQPAILKEVAPPSEEFIKQVKEQLTISFHKEVSPPLDEFIKQVKEQLIISFHTYEVYLHQEIPQQKEQKYCDPYAFKAELPTSCQSDIPSTHSPTSPVVNSDCALSDFIKHKERCSKFINQDLNFLESSNISSASTNVLPEDNSSVQVSQSQTQVVSSIMKLPTHTPDNQNSTPPTQIVEPVLGFMPADIQRAEAELKLMLEQLPGLESCKEYVQTPIQTVDGIHVHQPCQFLPLAKEAKKLVEALKKEKHASQWAGIPHEKLLQESFVEQLNSLQILEQLVPLKAFMPADIQRAEAELKLMLEQLPGLESCKEYVQTPIQTVDGIHVHQPCQFLPLAKEAKKLVEALKKEKHAPNGQVSHMKSYFKNHLLSN